jgi:hypothetical protein
MAGYPYDANFYRIRSNPLDDNVRNEATQEFFFLTVDESRPQPGQGVANVLQLFPYLRR